MEEVKVKKNSYTSAVGRRKEAVARVRVVEGAGNLTVNGKNAVDYFKGEIYQKLLNKPLELTKTFGKYAISVKVLGGGQKSQLDAVVHGIARALSEVNPDLRTILKKEKLLTRDARVKERRKYGNAQKARAKKQSPKR